MRRAEVFCRGVFAGVLSKETRGYRFRYGLAYLADDRQPAISLTLPKREAEYESPVLFPFFFGLLAEGSDKALQCRVFKIDENDHFTRLVRTCGTETIGGVTVREVSS
ncbi:MAG: HipA N-terminal domain-containing protein [Gemmataceae bacterium]|nr:HipA N-terminal domain-containing protein [Gemmataceae bacterium]